MYSLSDMPKRENASTERRRAQTTEPLAAESRLSLDSVRLACSEKLSQIYEAIEALADNEGTSYISNPQSFYYYRGRNPLKLLAKLALNLEHYLTTIPNDDEDVKETISDLRQQAKLKHQAREQAARNKKRSSKTE